MKTLFYGGKILTMAEPMYAEAVLVEDGKILAAGDLSTLKPMAGNCPTVDLQGKTMLPAFIDPHSHFFQVACSMLQASLDGCTDPQEMENRIQNFIREKHLPEGQWVIARDYDNNLLPDARHPALEEIDRFAGNRPLIIHHKSGHMGLLNSIALQKLGITADTPSPEGGLIEKKDGLLTGYLEENAFFSVVAQVPMGSQEQLIQAFRDTQKKYASYGITSLQDGMVAKPMLSMYEKLLREDLLDLDVHLYAGVDAYEDTKALLEKFPDNKHLKLSGIKIFLDGSPQGRTAWMRSPYEGSENYCGYGTMTDEAVEKAFSMAGDYNTQIIAHCNGDRAAQQFLDCMEKAQKTHNNLKNLRPVIIHGQLMGEDQLPKARELGVMVSFFVAHTYHWGDVHIKNFGFRRASRISPAASAVKEKVPFTFHQDAPVIAPDMLETIWCAVNRKTRSGVTLGEEEKISPLEAIKAVTVNAAYQYGEEGERGSISAGKAADFVILSEDPLTAEKDSIRNIQVLETYKAGTSVYRQ